MDKATTSLTPPRKLSLRVVAIAMSEARFSLLAFTGCAVLGCAGWAFLSEPIYRSSTVLAPVRADSSKGLSSALGQLGGLAALTGLNIDTRDSRVEEALAVLQSREFIERFIFENKLLPVLFPTKWDPHSERWTVQEAKVPTPWRGYRYFSRKVLSIERDKKTGLIVASVDWKDRNQAAAWVNDIVARANEEMRARALGEASAATRYLEDEREHTQLFETRVAINHLIESEIAKKTLATVTKEFAFRVVDRALPADVTDVLRPQKLLLVSIGAAGGLIIGCLFAFLRLYFKIFGRPRQELPG